MGDLPAALVLGGLGDPGSHGRRSQAGQGCAAPEWPEAMLAHPELLDEFLERRPVPPLLLQEVSGPFPEIQWNPTEIPLDFHWIPLESNGIQWKSNGIQWKSNGIQWIPMESNGIARGHRASRPAGPAGRVAGRPAGWPAGLTSWILIKIPIKILIFSIHPRGESRRGLARVIKGGGY